MINTLTSDELIESVKRRTSIPTDQNTYTDQDILDILNEELDIFGIPHLLRNYEEYLVYYEDLSLVAGQVEYSIPYRAVGNKLRDLSLVNKNSDGDILDIEEMSRINLDEISDYDSGLGFSNKNGVFYLRNNKVVLVDNSTEDYSHIRMWFYLRPNSLVEESKAATITAIDTSGS